jgi:hypothetical protein
VFAAEHLLHFAGLHFLVERFDPLCEFGVDRLPCFGPLDEDGEIVGALAQRHHQVAILLEALAALQDLLCFDLVFPEVGRGGLVLETGQFFVGAGSFKDSSADRQPGG